MEKQNNKKDTKLTFKEKLDKQIKSYEEHIAYAKKSIRILKESAAHSLVGLLCCIYILFSDNLFWMLCALILLATSHVLRRRVDKRYEEHKKNEPEDYNMWLDND